MSRELIERLRMEAKIHAQEARTANATIAEIYQLCSGGKGDPGNWHGAEPVRALIAERDAYAATLKAAQGGVTEAMVERFKVAFAEHSTISPAYDGCIRAALEATLSAQQGQAVAEVDWPSEPGNQSHFAPTVKWLDPHTVKHGDKLYTAPHAQPAERVPEGWREDVALAAQMLTWGADEGLTESQERDVRAHQFKLLAMLAASPAPSPARGDGGVG